MKKDIKIFFADLDGTLLNDQKIVTDKTKAALNAFIRQGNKFAICTGRPINSALQVFYDLNLTSEGSYIIAYNGAQIYDCERQETIYRSEVSLELVIQIFELGREYGIHCQTYTDTHIVSEFDNECTDYYRKNIHMPLLVAKNIKMELSQPPCKVMAIELHEHNRLEQFRIVLEKSMGEKLKLQYSSPNYLEIFSTDAGKGQAVYNLCKIINIPVKNSIAAGDEQNDISMLKTAGVGIAMCNGKEEVKRAADFITLQDNNHDGLTPFFT